MRLKTPEGLDTRPTNDRIKETLFNMLQPYLAESVFIDLFAGGGSIGIEALSRGAIRGYFVENQKEAYSCLVDNLRHTKLEDKATIIKQDVFYSLSTIPEKEVDLIFMDPPYHKGYERKVLEQLREAKYITPHTIMIVEASLDTEFDYLEDIGYEIMKEKKYKTNMHLFMKKKTDTEGHI